MTIRAIIFDFNGVILDDEELHFLAFQENLKNANLVLTQELYLDRYLGLNDWGFYQAFLKDHPNAATKEKSIDTWVEEKAVIYLRMLADEMPLFPQASQCIQSLSKYVPLAINSGARRHEIEKAIQWAKLTPCFQIVVSADEIRNGKPAPDGYLAAYEALKEKVPGLGNLQAHECLVIEDAPHGIASALNAGMPCVGVAQSQPAAELHTATWTIETIAEFTWENIQKHLSV
jgi:beta-phosphoglucomutase